MADKEHCRLCEAVYNGLCLEAENDDTTPWEIAGVGKIVSDSVNHNSANIKVQLKDGRIAIVVVVL